MTLFNHTFEGFTNGDTISAATSDDHGDSAFDSVATAGGNTITADTSIAFLGSVSCKFTGTVTASNNYAIHDFTATRYVAARIYYYLTANPSPATTQLITCLDGSNISKCQVRLDTSGIITVQGESGAAVSSATFTNAFPLNQWVRLEILVDRGTGASTGALTIARYLGSNSTAEESHTASAASFGTTDLTRVRIGKGTAGGLTYNIDAAAVESTRTTLIGPAAGPSPDATATPVVVAAVAAVASPSVEGAGTFLQNDADGGTDGANATAANTGGASGDAFDSVATVGNSITYDSTRCVSNALSYKFDGSNAANNNYVLWDFSAARRVAYRAYHYRTANPGTATVQLITFNDSAGVIKCQLRLGTDGIFVVQGEAGAAVQTFASAVVLNQWNRIELLVDRGTGANTGALDIAIYNLHGTTPIESYSLTGLDFGALDLARVRIGKGGASGTSVHWVDAIAVQTGATAFLGALSANRTVTPAGVAAVVAISTPAVEAQVSTIVTPATVAAIGAPAILDVALAVEATPSPVAAVAAIGSPAVVTGESFIVTPETVEAEAFIGSPVVTTITNAQASPAVVAAIVAIPSPVIVAQQNRTVIPITVPAIAQVGTPTVVAEVNITSSFTVWTGTVEQGLTLLGVWNGTAIVPATYDSVV